MKLYNTLSANIDELVPLNKGVVKLYTCGLTVYSQPHIGNWLGYIYWDVLVRVLMAEGLEVERTQNITDVGHLTSDDDNGEDKMEKGARSEGITAWDVAKKYSEIAEKEAYEMLGLLRPTHLIAATSCIDQQIEFATILDQKDYLYKIEGDGMYFDTSKLADYGKLARLDIAGLEAGARVSVEGKRNITDFAVWKFSPSDSKRDMEWQSPWGVGFPGWHLECSVIAKQSLGDQIDIHTGGIDHIPVHHSNEIAQTEAVTGKQFASVWLHNNHIKVDGTKISKSLGNVFTLQDILDKGYSLDAFKLLAFSKHYRTEGNFTWDIMAAAQNRLGNWRNVAALRHQVHDTLVNDDDKDSDEHSVSLLAGSQALLETLKDDIDTPGALKLIDEAFSRLENKSLSDIHQSSFVQFLQTIQQLLGIDLQASTPDITDEQKMLIVERQRARDEKNWERSDELRDQLLGQGIVVRDTMHGSVWQYS